MYNMDLIDKFNALLDRSTQAVDDTRRVFSRIEDILKPEETVTQQINILAITDFGFSDASFVQMDVKKDYMRKLRKRICEEYENEAVDVTVCFAGHKHNHKYKPKKMVKYVKYLTDCKLTKSKKNKSKKCKKRKHRKHKHRKHKHCDSDDDSSDSDDCDSSDSDDDDSDDSDDDCDSDDESDDDCDSDDETADDKINIKAVFIKYNDSNQYRKLTNNFDRFYVGAKDVATNHCYKRLITIIDEYKADPANKDNADTLARLDGINNLTQICKKDLGDTDMKKTTNKIMASYATNEDAKMLTHLNIHSFPHKVMLCYVILINLF